MYNFLLVIYVKLFSIIIIIIIITIIGWHVYW